MAFRLFHVSDKPDIGLFKPRPSPSAFDAITGNVVFAITEQLLPNYLLPRECPRVTYYGGPQTSDTDKALFLNGGITHVIAVESGWYSRIRHARLYCYEFPPESFKLLDACAGYYISCQPVSPISVTAIADVMSELLKHNVELRFMPDILPLAEAVRGSGLNYSLIRMRNAKGS